MDRKTRLGFAVTACLFLYGAFGGMVASMSTDVASQSMLPWQHPAVAISALAAFIGVYLLTGLES